jgi:hypothetical protein
MGLKEGRTEGTEEDGEDLGRNSGSRDNFP